MMEFNTRRFLYIAAGVTGMFIATSGSNSGAHGQSININVFTVGRSENVLGMPASGLKVARAKWSRIGNSKKLAFGFQSSPHPYGGRHWAPKGIQSQTATRGLVVGISNVEGASNE